MTNAEKFLKDGVKPEDFAIWLSNALFERRIAVDVQPKAIVDCLDGSIKPTLIEDERVILKNMQPQPAYITRDIDDDLTLRYDLTKGVRYSAIPEFNHLFQFIKYGEEYSIEELLKGE